MVLSCIIRAPGRTAYGLWVPIYPAEAKSQSDAFYKAAMQPGLRLGGMVSPTPVHPVISLRHLVLRHHVQLARTDEQPMLVSHQGRSPRRRPKFISLSTSFETSMGQNISFQDYNLRQHFFICCTSCFATMSSWPRPTSSRCWLSPKGEVHDGGRIS